LTRPFAPVRDSGPCMADRNISGLST
jgi:hypothetical protein